MIVNTPQPPYYAVIFSSIHNSIDDHYLETAKQMLELAAKIEGFIGLESARTELGITVSYWENLEAIQRWKQDQEHQIAQAKGRNLWYKQYKLRIAKIERDYGFGGEGE